MKKHILIGIGVLAVVAMSAGAVLLAAESNSRRQTGANSASPGQTSRNVQTYPRVLQTDDQYRLLVRLPEHWSNLRRGDQIVLWSTKAAIEGRANNVTLDRLEESNAINEQARTHEFVIVTILLVSGIQEPLESYANYVTDYSRENPIVDDVTRPFPLDISNLANLRLPHVVRGGKLFVQLDTSMIATVSVRVDAASSPSSLEPLTRQALEIVGTLERRQ